MKVARLYSFEDIRIEQEDLPEITDKDILVRTKACGICTGDVMPWYIERKAPLVLGHEPSGVVVKVGEQVKNFKEGDRVFIHHHAPCMECAFCKREDYVQCLTWKSSKIIPGGISEYILVPGLNLKDTLKLPDNVTFEAATLIEPLACVVKSLRRSSIKKVDTVLIIGLGIMGILHIILSRYWGASKIIGADFIPYRLNLALKEGADHVIDVHKVSIKDKIKELTKGKGPEIVIVGPNSVEAMKIGIEIVSAGGTVVLFTPAKPEEKLQIDPNYIYFKDINIVTSYSCGPKETREALKLIEAGIIKTDRLITHKFPIEETLKAYKIVAKANESLKVIIIFN